MNLEKVKPVNEEVAELKELIKELHGSVHQLQSEVQQLRHERPVVEVRKVFNYRQQWLDKLVV